MEYGIHSRGGIDTLYLQDPEGFVKMHWNANPSTEGKVGFTNKGKKICITFSDDEGKQNETLFEVRMQGTYDCIIERVFS